MDRATRPTDQDAVRVLAQLVAGFPFAAAVLDRELRYLAWNEPWSALHGLEADARGQPCGAGGEPPGSEWDEVLAACGAGCAWQREIAWRRGGGRTEHLRCVVAPWRDAAGAPGGSVVVCEVVTEQVALARRLEEREGFIRAFFDKSPVGLNLCRMDGLWLESNPAFLEMLGYTREEADEGLTYWQLTPRKYDADEQAQLASLRARARYGPYEKEFIRKDGSLVPVRLNGFLIERDGERFIWSLIEDISRQREVEQRLEQERLKVVQASKLATLGEMAAGIAHEINNPLCIIEAYAAQLAQFARDGDEAALDEGVRAIRYAVDRAARIVRGLRRFAREGSGEPPARVPLARLIDAALALCRARIAAGGVALRVAVDPDATALCSPIEFEQVIVNLVNNAFDAARDAPERWINVVGRARRERGEIEVRVEDSGPGVPPARVERIFEPFFTTKQVGDGTGLGLSISRGIVERLGGTLTYEPDAGVSAFVVRVPAG